MYIYRDLKGDNIMVSNIYQERLRELMLKHEVDTSEGDETE